MPSERGLSRKVLRPKATPELIAVVSSILPIQESTLGVQVAKLARGLPAADAGTAADNDDGNVSAGFS